MLQGKVVSVTKLTGPKATGETCDIVIETNGDIPYWEGQSYGVIPPVSAIRCAEYKSSPSCLDQTSAIIRSSSVPEWCTGGFACLPEHDTRLVQWLYQGTHAWLLHA